MMSHLTPTPTSATKPVVPILAAERMAGYREGLRTISQVAMDEARAEAHLQGWNEAKADCHFWGGFCFLIGIAVSVAFYGLVLQ
jgi:hypothetical protein